MVVVPIRLLLQVVVQQVKQEEVVEIGEVMDQQQLLPRLYFLQVMVLLHLLQDEQYQNQVQDLGQDQEIMLYCLQVH